MESHSSNIETSKYHEFVVTWQGIQMAIRHNPKYYIGEDGFGTQHIEVRSNNRVPLPITKTGYRSIFLNGAQALADFDDDPVDYVLTWLKVASKEKQWLDQQQMSLF